jgi:hypothetical protein
MNLTYAEQRALEIGITIAGGADVILLDEPTAGMSKSETARFVDLIREVTEGKTLLTVEHDMGVVFGLADRIAVLVYGEVIAFDTPEKVRANDRVQEAYLGSVLAEQQAGGGGALTCCIQRRARLLRQEPCAAWRALRGAARRDRQPCWGATARAAPPPSRPSWAWSTARARCSGRTSRSSAARPSRSPTRHRLRAREPRHLPQADGAPEPDAGPEAGAARAAALELRRHVPACSRA